MRKLQLASNNNKIMFDNKEVLIGERIVLNNVFFDTGKFTLRPESVSELDKWAKFLKENPTVKIEISGHTDNKGTALYNNTLSENRTITVRDYFVKNGVNKERMECKGYGFDQPIASNLTEEGQQKNRRTEIKIISKY
jgi:outer membrane protein OmpA-like peptidoglycan-associated protein